MRKKVRSERRRSNQPSRQKALPSSGGTLGTSVTSSSRRFLKDSDQANILPYTRVYEGKGTIEVKFFFREEGAPNPARLLIYTIPPGASEGVHVHKPGDAKLGSFDEFYYIISGSGEMEIGGERVPVTAGDHVFTPNGIAHGIENTSAEGDLKVYLLAVMRD
jgi:mannose-6-phosphate isomerase-like protein (cupin superfamily)